MGEDTDFPVFKSSLIDKSYILLLQSTENTEQGMYNVNTTTTSQNGPPRRLNAIRMSIQPLTAAQGQAGWGRRGAIECELRVLRMMYEF